MRFAITGPMPGKVSNCASVAEFKLSGLAAVGAFAFGALLEPDAESIGTHGRETIPQTGVHRLNGRNDPHQGHDSERDDGYSNTRAQFIAPNSPPCQGQVIHEFHGIKLVKPLV